MSLSPLRMVCTVTGALILLSLGTTGAWGQDTSPAPVAAYHAPTDPRELLQIDEPMRHHFGEWMRSRHPGADQLRGLLESILKPEGLNFAYDAGSTFAARETFRQRRGNCVSFAFLVVAVAREFGFRASFQDVVIPERWDRFGNLIISFRHMNVRVEAGENALLIDLRPDLVLGSGTTDMQVVGDVRAFAQFYDTAGVFALLQGRTAEALQYMTLATTTDPSFACAWSNLAVLQARLGNLAGARASYEHSLRADPHYLFALDGYVDVLRRLGSPDDLRTVAKHERRAQMIRERNPYYQQRLAERAIERSDWAGAEKLLRRAITLKDNEPQFHEALVTVLRQLGRDEDARRATGRLEKLRRRSDPASVHITR